MNKGNRPAADDRLSGTEGAVWYVTEPSGRVTMWKCKPESVEEIHWATGISKNAVIATCWNALETSDTLDYDVLLPLLLEEYQPGGVRLTYVRGLDLLFQDRSVTGQAAVDNDYGFGAPDKAARPLDQVVEGISVFSKDD